MEILFVVGLIVFIFAALGRGASSGWSGADEERTASMVSGSGAMNSTGQVFDDDDWYTNPAYAHMPGNIYYTSSYWSEMDSITSDDEISSSSLFDDDDSSSSLFDDDMPTFDDSLGGGIDDIGGGNIITDFEYFWMEGNIYHIDDISSCDDSFSSSFDDSFDCSSGFDDW